VQGAAGDEVLIASSALLDSYTNLNVHRPKPPYPLHPEFAGLNNSSHLFAST
jgi:hypothetical protein